MHTATDLSLLRVQEELDRLLDSYGFEKTEPVRPSGVEGYFEWVQSLVDASQAAAQRFKKRTNLFFKEILRIRKIRDDFAKLIRIDPTPASQESDATSRISHACAYPSSITGQSFQVTATASGNPYA